MAVILLLYNNKSNDFPVYHSFCFLSEANTEIGNTIFVVLLFTLDFLLSSKVLEESEQLWRRHRQISISGYDATMC